MSVKAATEPMFRPMIRQMNKMMEQMQKGFYSFCPSETWTPSVNLYETTRSYLVCVDLAGVVKNEIDLVVADGRLTLRGTRAVPVTAGADVPRLGQTRQITQGQPQGQQPQGQPDSPGAAATPDPAAAENASEPQPPFGGSDGESPDESSASTADPAQPRYRVHLMEIDHGQFVREVDLPEDVRKDEIVATYRNGLLWIEIPKQ